MRLLQVGMIRYAFSLRVGICRDMLLQVGIFRYAFAFRVGICREMYVLASDAFAFRVGICRDLYVLASDETTGRRNTPRKLKKHARKKKKKHSFNIIDTTSNRNSMNTITIKRKINET